MIQIYLRRGLVSLCLIFMSFSVFSQVKGQISKSIKDKKKGFIKELVFDTQRKSVRTSEVQNVFRNQLGLTEGHELRVARSIKDSDGAEHIRYQQYYKGIRVEDGNYIVHSKNGAIKSMNGEYAPFEKMDITASISGSVALNKAMQHVGAKRYLWEKPEEAGLIDYKKPKGELVIIRNRLAYKLDVYSVEPLYRADVYIDAKTGEFISENKKIHHANVAATGTSLYNGSVSFTADSYSGGYRLRQTVDGSGIQTFDLNNGTNYNNASEITSSSTNFTGNATGVQAHWGAEQTYSYFFNEHGRSSYNGNGALIRSYVSYSSGYVNAFWDGSRMTYGDGDGVNYGPLVSLDICGHEISHGVTEYSSNLNYSYESGALNESFSDIFGESIEYYASGSNDWLMGDEIGAGGSGGAIRSFSNPNSFGQPDTYQGSYWATGSADNGGVHTNSGVQNYWFYILSVGGSGTNDNGDSYNVTAIGMEKAAQIAYRVNNVYLTSTSGYAEARYYGIQAAEDLYGADSPEAIATQNAWYAVGIGSEYGGGTPDECATGTVTLTLVLDNYPAETSWTLASGGSTIASGGNYSSAGSTITETFTLADGDYIFTISDSFGDGICCSYGNGSYTLTDNGSGSTIASGGSFGSSDFVEFCVEEGDGGGEPDTEAPTTPGNLSVSSVTATSAVLSWSASTDNVEVEGYEVSVGGTLVGTTTSTSYNLTGLTASTSYSVTVVAFDEAENTSTAAAASFTTSGTPPASYCSSSGSNSSYEWIDLVQLGSISNSTTADGGYGDYTALSTDLTPGDSYTINFSAGFSNSSYTEYWRVWIDFNHDGDFTDSGEQLVSGSSSSAGTLSGTFSVPASVMLGTTRMRVTMRYGGTPSSCGSFTYGEVEDYTVNITNSIAAFASSDVASMEAERLGNEAPMKYFTVAPNPVKDFARVAISAEGHAYDLQLTTLNGRVISKTEAVGREVSIDMSQLPQGIYILSMKTEREVINTKIIKE
ncbi:M4 family metallopeptidase [Fulvivirga maritima]|uniref:M4 family metallopeptidase n=1 Tax=Fulvivirga maritima TaxID=2904247 RepID=UPI001F46EC42|nr:M4 family metallopeptidase [Fulvivirga maritima]UII28631.1 M4 family metallopeptidase [Fulvivirga maritima]